MASKIDLSVIVLSFNTSEITDHCLSCLKKAVEVCEKAGKKVEVLVVENASEDDSLEMLKKKHKWVELIVSKLNTGFSGGNNLAMKKAKGDKILLLNSDAYIKEDTLVESLEFFDSHPECDLLGPQLHFADGRLQPSAGYLPTPFSTYLWISGLALFPPFSSYKPYHPQDPSFFESLKTVEWIMGAYMMLKKEVFEKTGGFDETIFMYGEEIEWCKRIKDKGFRTFYNPEIKITHLDKASSKFLLEKPLLNEIRGIVRYFKQHYKNYYWWIKWSLWKWLFIREMIFRVLNKPQRYNAYKAARGVL
jgi:GT2 family glycosyltransferase